MKADLSYNAWVSSPYFSTKHSTYFSVYDKFFEKFCGKEITFVEIGVLNGGSLFMWREFFGPKARIIGVDLNPGAKRWESEGFEIFCGSQSDEVFWSDFVEQVGRVDIVLDDGGHTYKQQIITVESLMPNIKNGGVLVVEDTHTSYMTQFGGPSKRSFIEYAKNTIDGINYRFSDFSSNPSEKIAWGISFYESFVVFEIEREKCSVVSCSVDNAGEYLEAEDYRYDDSRVEALFKYLAKRYSSLERISGLRRLIVGIRNFLRLIRNMLENKKLSKYFKY
jgi:hypothetical protein